MAYPVKFNGMNNELGKPSSMDDLQCASPTSFSKFLCGQVRPNLLYILA